MLAGFPPKASGATQPNDGPVLLRVLRIALGRAMKLGYVHRNVATLVDPPAKVRHELRPIDRGRGRVS